MNLVRTWPQGQAGPTPLGWTWPQPLMPPRIDGWPRGVAPANDAEALLATAVGYWNASRYRDGDRFLRNQGIAGELLDLRLGSSVAPNTNDPTWLGVQDSGYVYLPGVASNYLSVPDENALDITGDIDIRVRVALDDWTPSSEMQLLAKENLIAAGYGLAVPSSGVLRLYWGDGTHRSRISTVSTGIADGSAKWVRATLDVDNGAGGHDVKFYLSDDGVTWSQLGATVTTAGTASIVAGSSVLYVGTYLTNVSMSAGSVYRAIVKNGIDGTTVLDVDCDAITSGSATSFTAATGQTVTINRPASGRKSVAMPSRWNGGRPCFLLGTDDYLECVDNWQHQLLNFGQGDSFTVLAVVRQWATPINQGLVTKGGSSGNSRWATYIPNATYKVGLIAVDNAGVQVNPISESTGSGTLSQFAATVDSTAKLSSAWSGATPSATASTRSLNMLTNTNLLQVGRWGANYLNGEFRAAAIFRRALTRAEITTLSTYWGS